MVSASRSEKLLNEDAIGLSRGVWMVADGASALFGGDLLGTGSDAAWLASRLCQQAFRFEDPSHSIEEILRSLLKELSAQFPACSKDEQPSCALAIVRRNKNSKSFDYFVLGDCFILMDTKDGVLRFSDPAVGYFDDQVIARMKELAAQQNIPFLQTRALDEIHEMLKQNRTMKNQPGGYSVTTLQADWNEAISGSIPHHSVRSFVMGSDGFDQLSGFLHLDDAAFLSHVLAHPGQAMDELYELQENDPACLRLPRLKKRDDTTMIVEDSPNRF